MLSTCYRIVSAALGDALPLSLKSQEKLNLQLAVAGLSPCCSALAVIVRVVGLLHHEAAARKLELHLLENPICEHSEVVMNLDGKHAGRPLWFYRCKSCCEDDKKRKHNTALYKIWVFIFL